ncbi:HAMP domain-containing sensor histidine kinase [Alkalibaculum bacchi]|uniref:HAMP domain-containing sensor histidine kinase n=1 Tax=Alkalibaculum bacchi TaxID=645887 RepID=UPI0026F2AFDE|nr:HAMP domain-containing sensor histidine kinase [Alkalibaculum bacchi]
MGIRKSTKLRTTFIKYVVSLGLLIIILILVNYYLFIVASIGVYPANYSEKIIQSNYDELKNLPRVTIELLTPMCNFGVYSEEGDFLYGNFSSKDIKINWDRYQQGKTSTGLEKYIITIDRDEGILIITYPLTAQYRNEILRRTLPNAELTIVIVFFIQLIALIILWSNRFAKKVNNELKTLLIPMAKIQEQNLDFNVGTSNIEEISMVLKGIDKMKNSLKKALEEQWSVEQQKREQISALAHDIKTPLTIIKGNVGLLGETNLTNEQKSYCGYIEESSEHMEGYLKSLLTITKKEIDYRKSDEIISAMKTTNFIRSQGEALGKIYDLNMIWNIDIEEDLYIQGNKDEFERALMNILSNAVEFSSKNSSVIINGFIDNSYLIIQVIDQGNGFSKKMLKYGKQRFTMDNDSRTKTGHHGLGLYIANTIITKYHGELILSNDKNGGGSVTTKIQIFQRDMSLNR